jgi:hypothetical protein
VLYLNIIILSRGYQEKLMKVSRDDAQEALDSIQQVTMHTKRAIASGSSPYYMILWGIIWFLGFISDFFIKGMTGGWAWISLVGIGSVISIIIGFRSSLRVRVTGSKRFTLLPVVVIVYSLLVIWICQPLSGEQISVIIVLFAMLGYVIMGILVEPAAIWVGITTTGLALMGYFLLLPYYNLWMAFLSGGTLVAGGLYILRKWK